MKYEIYEPKIEMPKPEPVRLKLVKDINGVGVIAVDEKGKSIRQGCLIYFELDGTIKKARDVNPDLGFQLDKEGRIKEKD